MNKVIEKGAWSLRENTKLWPINYKESEQKGGTVNKSHRNPYSKVCTSNKEIIRKKKGEKKEDHEQRTGIFRISVTRFSPPIIFSLN